jgi:hypothetical protein
MESLVQVLLHVAHGIADMRCIHITCYQSSCYVQMLMHISICTHMYIETRRYRLASTEEASHITLEGGTSVNLYVASTA